MTAVGARPADAGGGAATGAKLAHPPEWPVYRDDTIESVARMLRAGRSFDYGHGPEIAALEEAFARYHGRRHALALNSGTSALFAAYFALGLGEGDEVATQVYTFFSAVSPLLLLGAVPVLTDVAPATGQATAEGLAAAFTSRTRAIAVTHLWGNPGPMDAIIALARERGVPLVEDCSHAHGARYRGRPVGSLADISVFSIGGHKAVSGGLGGMLLTDDPDLYARACLLANFRHRTDLTIHDERYAALLPTGLGGNLRISPTAAVLALEHLESLDVMVSRRQANMGALVDGLTALPGIRAVPVGPGSSTGAWYDGVVEVGDDARLDRDTLVRLLQSRGLNVRAPSTRPLHHYPLFRGSAPDWSPRTARAARAAARSGARAFPRADHLFAHWLRLPVSFLYEQDSPLPGRYVEEFAELLA
ncbi:DegT/DnrJ/EryC1/StrS family aminotransferase [Streptomyces sp. NPDC087270]|uniref:DegT/DnrJ/EryC1/StrS family aminotransferase n=1 Tax=Streptomyces sp. NPDC087270 TaxID=3365774 RepID=UPI0037F2177B